MSTNTRRSSKEGNDRLIKLNLGCGIGLVSGFINVDKFISLADLKSRKGYFKNAVIPNGAEFLQADICKLPFEDNSIDYIESIDCLEHLPFREVPTALREMARVIKPGHKICFETTNFDDLAKRWTTEVADSGKQATTRELEQIIYGNQQGLGQFHQAAFNPNILSYYLDLVGLKYRMVIYPQYSAEHPGYQTIEWVQGSTMRAESIWVEAHK